MKRIADPVLTARLAKALQVALDYHGEPVLAAIADRRVIGDAVFDRFEPSADATLDRALADIGPIGG